MIGLNTEANSSLLHALMELEHNQNFAVVKKWLEASEIDAMEQSTMCDGALMYRFQGAAICLKEIRQKIDGARTENRKR